MKLSVSVPATSANLGPGYDVLGLALSIRNHFHFASADRWTAAGQPIDPAQHLALHTAIRAAEHFGGRLHPLAITWDEAVPRSRGMGSSATARVAGLEAALAFTGLPIPLEDRLQFLTHEEGHPDNVVPAAVGGLTLCSSHDDGLTHLRFDPPPLAVALCIPAFEVSTPAARARIPSSIPHSDAVHNVAAVSFLLAGLIAGRTDAIALGLRDRLHQPYRLPLIPGATDAFEAAIGSGALGAFVSGSGSTLAALVGPESDPQRVADAMAACFDDARALVVQPDRDGAQVTG